MKKLFVTALVAMIGLPVSGAFAQDTDKLSMEARAIIKKFVPHLKGTLIAAMKKGGPVNALDVCKTKALPLTRNASKSSGWNVGRTSLKLRNPSNRADSWERAVLKEFEAKKAAGADPKKLEKFEIVDANGKKMFRYMKAIPTGKACLHCHGTDLKPAVKDKLTALYPLDKATGFKPGDIRGAFTLSKELK